MAIFRSDIMTPSNAAGVSTNQGIAYAPIPATPQVPSAPSTTAQISALSQRAPTQSSVPSPVSSNPLFSGIQSAVQSLSAVAQALAQRGSQAQQVSGPAPTPASATTPTTTSPPGQATVSSDRTYSPYTTGNGTTPAVLPTDFTRQPITPSLTDEQRIAGYKPELVQGMGGTEGFSVTTAGLGEPPKRQDFPTLEAFQNAEEAYRENVLAEQSAAASSSAFQQATSRNAEMAAAQSQNARTAAFEATRGEIERRQKNEREALIQSLANRGLTIGRDSFADDKLRDFDRLAAQEREAKYSEFLLGQAQMSDDQRARAQKVIDDRIKSVKDAMTAFETIKAKRSTAELAAKKTDIADAKQKADELYKKGVLTLKERDQLINAAEAESKQDLREAQTKNVDQKTVESKALTPVKVEDIKAGTELKKAQTDRINKLTPVDIQEKMARINKLLRPTGSGSKGAISATEDDFNKAYDSLLLAGVSPTDKAVALAIKRLKGDTNPQITETALKGVTDRTKAREEGKPKQSGTDTFLQTLING